jgi:glycosyltransferase involved in cell wall biosynthesis
MKLNYISSESLKKTSGGWSGNNYNIYTHLLPKAEINYIGPINPKPDKLTSYLSKIEKLIGVNRRLPFFSEKRLKKVSTEVKSKLIDADCNFFWGQMPFLQSQFNLPYAVYLDAGIRTYLRIFLPKERIKNKEIERIEKLESEWLSKASHIFWGSHWAKNEAEKSLTIDNKNQHVVWVGGNVQIPEHDSYQKNLNFIFISLRFKEKGGFIAFEAFKNIQMKFPEATLTIIGEQPPSQIINHKGVIYAGHLNKTNSQQLKKFEKIISQSFCLLHPTSMDTLGQVIIECGYYGCPTIAPASFGIPELLIDGKTGILLKVPFSVDSITEAALELVNDSERYFQMRQNTRNHCINNLNYNVIANKIIGKLNSK